MTGALARIASALCFAFMLIGAEHAFAEKRVALVIGNNAYASLGAEEQLQKAVNDAHAVGDALEQLGFEVARGENLSRVDMLSKLIATAGKVGPGDLAVFFYAGHGVSLDGANYLLPADIPSAEAGGESLIELSAIPEATVIETLKRRGVRVAMIVLDACRNNPFSQGGTRAFGGTTRGLARPPDPAQGVFGLYSAGYGEQALDRLSDADDDPNSVFTRVLVPALRKPGLSLLDIAYEVNEEVARLAETIGHEQHPAHYDQARARDLFLTIAPKAPPTTAVAAPDADCSLAEAHYREAREIGTRAALQDHIRRFGNCAFAGLAEERIALFETTLAPNDGERIIAVTASAAATGDAAAPAHPGAQPAAAACETLTVGIASDEMDTKAAIPVCGKAVAEAPGNDELTFLLGRAHDAAGDYKAALAQYEAAAKRGHADAQFHIGRLHALGNGVKEDKAEAARWFRLAADQGHARAQAGLGRMHYRGEGVKEDKAEAVRWFRSAADQGRADAQINLALSYYNGEGVPRDFAEAAKYFRMAAEQGEVSARYNLALMYFGGAGVKKDDTEAARWFRLAAEQKDANANWALGGMYYIGAGGLPKDMERAAKYFLDALALKSEDAQRELVEKRARGLSADLRRAIQDALRVLGAYSGTIDGVFGPGTRAALEQFSAGG